MDTYELRGNCANCRTIVRLNIPRGTTIKEYMGKTEEECPRCGVAIKLVEENTEYRV